MAFSKNSKCSEIGPRGVMASLIIKESVKIKKKQAWAELCQAQGQFGLAWFGEV